MLYPTAIVIRPQYIAESLEKIAEACPLEKVIMVCGRPSAT